MADLKVLSTDKCFWRIDDGTAALLLEMFPAAIERVNPRPQPKPEELVPLWSVEVEQSGYHFAAFRLLGRFERYVGAPSGLVAYFAKIGAVVPEHIAQNYRQLWKPREFEHPAVARAYWAEYNAIHGIKE
jgi:hypothetical protein